MANVIKLGKGLNIHLKGTAAETKRVVGACTEYVVRPDTFEGVVPKLVIHEGDRGEVGDALFVGAGISRFWQTRCDVAFCR